MERGDKEGENVIKEGGEERQRDGEGRGKRESVKGECERGNSRRGGEGKRRVCGKDRGSK